MTQLSKPPTKQIAKQKGVMYLEKSRLQIYTADKPNVLAFDIAPTITHDIEIFNKDELNKQLTAFLKVNAVTPAEFVVILAQNVLFEKDFNPANPEEQKKFVDSVPFEYLGSKEYPNEKGTRVVVANSDFYNSIQTVLAQNGSSVAAVVPYFTIAAQMNGLDQVSIGVAMGQFSQLKNQSFTTTQETEFTIAEPDKVKKNKKSAGKEIFALVGIFVILIGILVFMIFKPAPKPNVSAAPVPALPVVVPTGGSTVPGAAVPSVTPTVGKEQIVIQITYDTSKAQEAQTLKDSLLQASYKNVTLSDGGTVSTVPPQAAFSSNLPADLKNEITNIIKTNLPDAVLKETVGTSFIVAITIGG